MKLCLGIAISALACAQSTTGVYQRDLNGNVVQTQAFAANDHTKTEVWSSMNGRKVPLEQTTEKVISDSGGVKVTERITQKFDPTGRLTGTERVVKEETKLGDGATVKETTYRGELNGGSAVAERKTTETHVQGSTTTTNMMIDRPGLSGSFETAEKHTAVQEGSDTKSTTTESVYRRDGNGGFSESERLVKTYSKDGDKTDEKVADYAPGVTGSLTIAKQTATTTTKRSDGTEVSEVNVYGRGVTGWAQDTNAPLRIKEQQIIERKVGADGSVTEILSERRPSVTSPETLGAPQKVSETVCTGKCVPDKPIAVTAQPSTKPAENSRP